jgi:transposase
MLCPAIDYSGICEIRAATRVLHAKNMSAVEIHRELCALYNQNTMSEGNIRQWCNVFKDGQTNVHDEERSVRPSVVSDDRVQTVDENICEKRRFAISELSS